MYVDLLQRQSTTLLVLFNLTQQQNSLTNFTQPQIALVSSKFQLVF